MDALVEVAADIVAAYVSKNPIPASELTQLITSVHSAISKVAVGPTAAPEPKARPEPAVPIKRSVTPDFIICLEDGKKFKSLKRHLSAQYQMTPEAYRRRWDLPPDYPMVAPSYSDIRSKLAKSAGLGVTGKSAATKRTAAKNTKKAA